jgi:glutaredoxin
VARLTLYTRQGCHLCEQARSIIDDLVAGTGHVVEVIDVDDDPAVHERHAVRVPVVEVDGREVAQYQVDATALRLALPELRPRD